MDFVVNNLLAFCYLGSYKISTTRSTLPVIWEFIVYVNHYNAFYHSQFIKVFIVVNFCYKFL